MYKSECVFRNQGTWQCMILVLTEPDARNQREVMRKQHSDHGRPIMPNEATDWAHTAKNAVSSAKSFSFPPVHLQGRQYEHSCLVGSGCQICIFPGPGLLMGGGCEIPDPASSRRGL